MLAPMLSALHFLTHIGLSWIHRIDTGFDNQMGARQWASGSIVAFDVASATCTIDG